MSRLAYFAAAVILTAFVAAPSCGGSTNMVFVGGGQPNDGAADSGDESSPIIATGDFNRDGIADLVEATSPGGKESRKHVLKLLLGRADGTFRTAVSEQLIDSDPRALVVGDFNGDGNLDVIVGDGNGSLLEFLGDGKGNIDRQGKIATFGSVASIAAGHFTHHRNLDLVVSDSRSNSAVILLGTGNGSFQFAWSFKLPRQGREFHIATADFNKDGIDDLVIGSDDADDYEVMLGNGNGTFTFAPQLSHIRDPNSYCPS